MAKTRLEQKRHTARRQMRADSTPLEDRLWRALIGIIPREYDLLRQERLGPYLADIVSHRLRLIIEVDGEQHGAIRHRNRDAIRDGWLSGHGYSVLRFRNDEVRLQLGAVLDTIHAVAEERREMAPAGNPLTQAPRVGKPRPRPRRR